MKIPTKGTSPYLTIDDVPAPIIATMDHVTYDQSLRNPYVLHFADDQLSPLPLNVTNRRTIVNAFGNDDQQWHGRHIEVYVNADVANARGEVTGGIRLRIPAPVRVSPATRAGQAPVPPSAPPPAAATGPRAGNGAGARAGAAPGTRPAPSVNGTVRTAAAPKPAPGPKMVTAPPNPAATPGPADNHAKALAGMNAARDAANLDAWARWRRQIDGTTPDQDDEAEDAYHRNKERIALGAAPGRRSAWPTA